MSLSSKLARAGFDVIFNEQLGIPEDFPLPEHYNSITWAFSRRMLKSSIWIQKIQDFYPVVVGNFGCGPDSFTFPLIQEIFKDQPSLSDHASYEAGVGLSGGKQCHPFQSS